MKNVIAVLIIIALVGCGQVALFDGGYEINGTQITLTGSHLDKVDSVSTIRPERELVKSDKRDLDIVEKKENKLVVKSRDGVGYDETQPIAINVVIEKVTFVININVQVSIKPTPLEIVCPGDFMKVGDAQRGYFCMSANLQTELNWTDTQTSCASIGTTVCSFGQHSTACHKGLVPKTEKAWTDDLADMNTAISTGGASCDSLYQDPSYSVGIKHGFRCCAAAQTQYVK